MTERSVTVQPGMVNPLGDTLATGTTLFNLDPSRAVWVSSDPGITPGQGSRIGGYGSVQWQGGPCYAVVDTGVTGGVPMTLSDRAVAPVNPVDIATAIAAQGVPSVLVGKMVLYQAPVSVVSATIPYQLPVDVSQYASLTLYVTATKPQRVTLDWLGLQNAAGNPLAPDRTYILSGITGVNATIALNVPIKGPRLNLFFSDPSDTGLLITAYASNRAIPASVAMPSPFYQSQIPSRAWGAFSTASFPDALTTNGGPHHIRGNANLAGQKGYLVLSLLDGNGAAVDVPVIDSGSGSTGPANEALLGGTVILPAGRYFPRWQNAGTAGTFAPLLTIIPQP